MIDEEITLSPLEVSRMETGRRFYIVNAETYTDLVALIDADRGFPNGRTMTAMSPVEQLHDATDGSGKLVSVSTFSVKPTDEPMLNEAMDAGLVEEVDEVTFLSLAPEIVDPFES